MKPGLLVTADGEVFRGTSVGVDGVAMGEVVFNTAMTGYQEILTDPSYSGQVVVLTAPHIGNYGTAPFDEQSSGVHARSLITRSMSQIASSWRSTDRLDHYLRQHGVVALSNVDTRRLTRHIRDKGAMSVAVGVDVDERELMSLAAGMASLEGQDLVSAVTTTESYFWESEGPRQGHVVAYDFGIKTDIIRSMTSRGLDVTVLPASASAAEVRDLKPDAVLLSNGPGDPQPLVGPIVEIRELLGTTPVFGVCLGHQLLALALGAETFKLPFGHHGGNHPVQRISDGSVQITSQNHGFAVELASLGATDPHEQLENPPSRVATPFGEVSATHMNLNDGTNEGITCHDITAFSVQFHPEAAPGPNDASVLFDRFVNIVRGEDAGSN
jgi:carbamoyl-phosphate synthase small subunit